MGETTDAHARTRSGGDRSGSSRATRHRRAAEDALLDAILLPNARASESAGTPAQTLLMKALIRIERQPGVGGAVAWALGPDAQPRVLAAQPALYANQIGANAETYAALAQIPETLRLTDGDLPADLMPLAARGVTAVAPVAGFASTAAAILLVFSRSPLRPRTIAVLDEVATNLAASISTQLALDRLGQLDSAVQRIDRLAALGGLVSEIVHEVRNPLVSVKTFLQLLPERLDDEEFLRDFRGLVMDEVQRLESMLDDLLRHARPSATADADRGAPIRETIQSTLQLLTYRCRERGVELETKIAENLPPVAITESALRQLLLNLLLNATQVTEAGGQVLLSVDWSPTEVDHLQLLVEDEGPGIDPSLGAKLFEPFWTTRAQGAGGLGLAICKRIVEEAGGSIAVHKARKGGACFRVELKIVA
jgi:signal transduction histidine kinase